MRRADAKKSLLCLLAGKEVKQPALSKGSLEQAVALLHRGGLVAFPTETVYGLGADATSDAAVERIFVAKGRPSNNPLIVHVPDIEAARKCVTHWPGSAELLARRFWPGPLTLVLPKASAISSLVTAGGETAGVRVPNHPVALELLRSFAGPLAAPSANRANHISPTTAEHVQTELGGRVDLILDGGPCMLGIESTVLDLTAFIPTILRPGAIGIKAIRATIGEVRFTDESGESANGIARSPGQLPLHYAPRKPAWRVMSMDAIPASIDPRRCALLTFANQVEGDWKLVIAMPAEADNYAAALYAALRRGDESDGAAIIIHMPPNGPEWVAVLDRIHRATRPV